MPSFTVTLHKILKTVFDSCGLIMESANGSFEYDEDSVWYATSDFPSVWAFIKEWLVALPDEEMPDKFSSKDVKLFWARHGKRMLRRWESFGTLTPIPQLHSHFSTCIARSVPGELVRKLRDYILECFIAR